MAVREFFSAIEDIKIFLSEEISAYASSLNVSASCQAGKASR